VINNEQFDNNMFNFQKQYFAKYLYYILQHIKRSSNKFRRCQYLLR
jgi:hypothetical protein